MRSISSADRDSTDSIPTPSPDQQAGDDRKWNVDEEKKLTDAVHALGEKSNQVRDSRGQWEAEQSSAASSSVGASRSAGASSSHSRSNGGGSASQSAGSSGGSQGGVSSSGQSYWVETQTEDPSLGWSCSGTLGSDPTRCWGNDGKEMHKGADGRWH